MKKKRCRTQRVRKLVLLKDTVKDLRVRSSLRAGTSETEDPTALLTDLVQCGPPTWGCPGSRPTSICSGGPTGAYYVPGITPGN